MTPAKRAMDLFCALGLAIALLPLILVVALIIRVRDGAPVLYLSERMKTDTKAFQLWKFRTMTVVEKDSGVSGGDKASRITKSGAFLRKYRLDELPQLWNVIRGDISFVGPRPPLRRYVEQFPDLYHQVLKSRPGITGLATLAYHKTEEDLLKNCRTAAETEAVYTRRCIPKKAALDLIYAKNRSVCWDFRLMLATVIRRIPVVKRDRDVA